jgi:2-polyprenyl-3-methyl-5-hydroxy-6-metoxy-1,4-benzoquinol methylase
VNVEQAVNLTLRPEQLSEIWAEKYGSHGPAGSGPRLRRFFGHFNPDDHYEALVESLLSPGAVWADVGCGRDIFPSNPTLARRLVSRCAYVLGIDPDENIDSNPYISEAMRGLIQDYVVTRQFDLVTLRMVAEHITEPEPTILKLGEMLRPGGRVVIYTPYKWAPVSFVTRMVPFALHHPIKKFLWGTETRDTFPVAFRMNTRGDLKRFFSKAGFVEEHFQLLDDCRSTSRFLTLNALELTVCKLLNAVGLKYPECCVLAVYRKTGA